MSNEEMARFLNRVGYVPCAACGDTTCHGHGSNERCTQGIMKWLESKVNDI